MNAQTISLQTSQPSRFEEDEVHNCDRCERLKIICITASTRRSCNACRDTKVRCDRSESVLKPSKVKVKAKDKIKVASMMGILSKAGGSQIEKAMATASVPPRFNLTNNGKRIRGITSEGEDDEEDVSASKKSKTAAWSAPSQRGKKSGEIRNGHRARPILSESMKGVKTGPSTKTLDISSKGKSVPKGLMKPLPPIERRMVITMLSAQEDFADEIMSACERFSDIVRRMLDKLDAPYESDSV